MSTRYIGLVSGFYQKRLFLQLSIHADRLFQGMLYLAWKAEFPERLQATIAELQEIGNLPKQSTFYKAKAELTSLTIDGKTLLTANKDKTHTINYNLLSDSIIEEIPQVKPIERPKSIDLPLQVSELKKKYGEPFWIVVNTINDRCAVSYIPLPRDHNRIVEISEFPEKEISIAIGKAIGINPYMKPPGIYSYIISILREERAKQNNRKGVVIDMVEVEDKHDLSNSNLIQSHEVPDGWEVVDILAEARANGSK